MTVTSKKKRKKERKKEKKKETRFLKFYIHKKDRVVTKICQVNTTSRGEIKQLGISFGSIFLPFSYESIFGKSPAPAS